MKHEIESVHFLRQLQKAKKLSLELAEKESQSNPKSPNPTGRGDQNAGFAEDDILPKTLLLKNKSPVRRRSIANSSRHSRSSRHFHLSSTSAVNDKSPSPSPAPSDPPVYVGCQRFIDVEVDGHQGRINVYDRLEIVTPDELVGSRGLEKEEAEKENTPKKSGSSPSKRNQRHHEETVAHGSEKFPQPSFRTLEKNFVPCMTTTPRPEAYYRYIEKTTEELEEDVEYEMDCEDLAWLKLYNEHRQKMRMPLLIEETFEILMDRLEKEAHSLLLIQGSSTLQPIVEDDDVVCAICLDDECQNTNVILFCDKCNLAVHQECYGVPYVPEGQWLCSRCLAAPSGPVSCCLCPVKDGAMKQTNDGQWAHIICALWIPEVGFGNIDSLEPITKIEKVPPARQRLTCSICKQKGIGACIQCMKKNCFIAFHVTCAQQTGLYMTIEPTHNEDGSSNVRKTILCNQHKPANARPFQPMYDSSGMETDDDNKTYIKSKVTTQRSPRGQARAHHQPLLPKKNGEIDSKIELIPQERLMRILETLKMKDKVPVLSAVQSYWGLKRTARNGLPLLRRLQAASLTQTVGMPNEDDGVLPSVGLKDLRKLRQDMEKVRLLLELIRKRERLKLEETKLHEKSLLLELEPFNDLLRQTLDQLQAKDRSGIFAFPVPLKELPDYASKISHPMDFSTMRGKIDRHEYHVLDDFIHDFQLIITNCTTYNAKHTLYHKAAIRIRQQAEEILATAGRVVEKTAFFSTSGLYAHTVEAHNKSPRKKRTLGELAKPASAALPLEDRRSSDRHKMPTRRYLIDDEVATVLQNTNRTRKLSSDSEEPPVLSRCPSPVDTVCISAPPPRKRSRLGNFHGDPPLLVKSVISASDSHSPTVESSVPPIAGKATDWENLRPVVSIGAEINSRSRSPDAFVSAKISNSSVPETSFQGTNTELTDSNLQSIEDTGTVKQNDFESSPKIGAPTDTLDMVLTVMESDGSNSVSEPSSETHPFVSNLYLARFGNLKVDSAYGSASCSSSDSDNSDKQ